MGSQGGDVHDIRGQHLYDGTGDISGYALGGHRHCGVNHRRCRYQTSQLDSSIRIGSTNYPVRFAGLDPLGDGFDYIGVILRGVPGAGEAAERDCRQPGPIFRKPVEMSDESLLPRAALLAGHGEMVSRSAARGGRSAGIPSHRNRTGSQSRGTVRAEITLVQGDITRQRLDAVVNAANNSLLGGGGVDGAIHRRGGPVILAECRELRASHYQDGLPTGRAVATTAGELPARWVIHTVGPVYATSEDRSDLLASCYRESLRVADELGAVTVAFPAVSAGVYGWPLDDAARIAVGTVHQTATSVREARFVLFNEDVHDAFQHAFTTLP